MFQWSTFFLVFKSHIHGPKKEKLRKEHFSKVWLGNIRYYPTCRSLFGSNVGPARPLWEVPSMEISGTI